MVPLLLKLHAAHEIGLHGAEPRHLHMAFCPHILSSTWLAAAQPDTAPMERLSQSKRDLLFFYWQYVSISRCGSLNALRDIY
ncbi:hypothetical protein V6N12_036582 [Hibiscus sabdariffa]|uniref:Uncharacterized protein n=1 Tax=Hibiscus sabdariffa TaxID=183260 RepID=A0ABR2ER02_9ROSI